MAAAHPWAGALPSSFLPRAPAPRGGPAGPTPPGRLALVCRLGLASGALGLPALVAWPRGQRPGPPAPTAAPTSSVWNLIRPPSRPSASLCAVWLPWERGDQTATRAWGRQRSGGVRPPNPLRREPAFPSVPGLQNLPPEVGVPARRAGRGRLSFRGLSTATRLRHVCDTARLREHAPGPEAATLGAPGPSGCGRPRWVAVRVRRVRPSPRRPRPPSPVRLTKPRAPFWKEHEAC